MQSSNTNTNHSQDGYKEELLKFLTWFKENYPDFYDDFCDEFTATSDKEDGIELTQSADVTEEEQGVLRRIIELYHHQKR